MTHSGAIIFVHGSFGCAKDFSTINQRLLPLLQKHNYRIECFELPAHGEALDLAVTHNMPREHEQIFAYTSSALQALVRRTHASISGRPTLLVGYSMGARIAAHAATAVHDVLSHLVLESVHLGMLEHQRRERLERDRFRAEQLVARPRAMLEQFWNEPVFSTLDKLSNRRALLDERIRRAERDPHTLAHAFLGLSLGFQPLVTLPQSLSTTFITGMHDEVYTDLAARYVTRSPNARFYAVPDAGHNVHLENPSAYVDILSTCILSTVKGQSA